MCIRHLTSCVLAAQTAFQVTVAYVCMPQEFDKPLSQQVYIYSMHAVECIYFKKKRRFFYNRIMSPNAVFKDIQCKVPATPLYNSSKIDTIVILNKRSIFEAVISKQICTLIQMAQNYKIVLVETTSFSYAFLCLVAIVITDVSRHSFVIAQLPFFQRCLVTYFKYYTGYKLHNINIV